MEEINLLQNQIKDTTFNWRRYSKLMLVILVVVLILLLGASAGLFLQNQSLNKKISAIQADNQAGLQQLSEQEKKLGPAKSFQAQLANLRLLLNDHTYLSPLMDELSKFTYQRAQFVAFNVVEGGKIHVEGKVGTYGDLSKTLLGLSTSSKIKNVKLLSVVPASGETAGFGFSIDMNVTPDIFIKQ